MFNMNIQHCNYVFKKNKENITGPLLEIKLRFLLECLSFQLFYLQAVVRGPPSHCFGGWAVPEARPLPQQMAKLHRLTHTSMDAEAFKHLGDSELGDSQRVVHSQNEITSCCSVPHTHSHPPKPLGEKYIEICALEIHPDSHTQP